MDLCVPESEAIDQKKYEEIVEVSSNVDQIAQILIRYKNLPQSTMESLCFVIPRIDSWDFTLLRDDKVTLQDMKKKI